MLCGSPKSKPITQCVSNQSIFSLSISLPLLWEVCVFFPLLSPCESLHGYHYINFVCPLTCFTITTSLQNASLHNKKQTTKVVHINQLTMDHKLKKTCTHKFTQKKTSKKHGHVPIQPLQLG
jgi:hypothetical protein